MYTCSKEPWHLQSQCFINVQPKLKFRTHLMGRAHLSHARLTTAPDPVLYLNLTSLSLKEDKEQIKKLN